MASQNVGWELYDAEREFKRLGVLPDPASGVPIRFRLSRANVGFKLSPSYPSLLVLPALFPDEELPAVASFRSEQRLPALCWANAQASLWRSSQPKVGVSGASCPQDVTLLALVAAPTLHIVDCRPKTSARANALTGHGSETAANYPFAKVRFFGMENIHAVRDAFQRMQKLALAPAVKDAAWGALVEDTRWLQHIRTLLVTSHEVWCGENGHVSSDQG